MAPSTARGANPSRSSSDGSEEQEAEQEETVEQEEDKRSNRSCAAERHGDSRNVFVRQS